MTSLALLAALLAAAPAATAPPPAPTIGETLAICRAVYFSDKPEKAIAAWQALPADAKASVAFICLAYRQGALDLQRASEAAANQPQKD